MSGENVSNFSQSNLSTVMTTADEVQTTVTMATSSSALVDFYFQCLVIAIGCFGAAANGLILYGMIASKQHKKQFLIFNQNMLDLASCVVLVVTYSLKLCNIYHTGTFGYWVCIVVLSGNLIWSTINGSHINLMSITIERYLKLVHPTYSKKVLRKWVIYSAAAFAWIAPFAYNLIVVLSTSFVKDGVCYGYFSWKNDAVAVAHGVYYVTSFYIVVICIFVFCYGRILMVIRNQARVMAGHGGPGPSTAQTHSDRVQTNVIKTMMFVSAFFIITFTPDTAFYTMMTIKPGTSADHIGYHITMICAFLYITANPFIYAVKFDPVRRVLAALMPCTKSQPAGESVATATIVGITRTDQKPN